MRLPMPAAEEIESFRQLYNKMFGIELTEAEATEGAIRILHIYFLKHYAIHSIQSEE